MAPGEDDTALRQQVQNLAPKLFNAVLGLVLIIDTGEVAITRDYKPPVGLRINSSIRETSARDHHQRTIFIGLSAHCYTLFMRWLCGLAPSRFSLVRHIEVACLEHSAKSIFHAYRPGLEWRQWQLNCVWRSLNSISSIGKMGDLHSETFRMFIGDLPVDRRGGRKSDSLCLPALTKGEA